MPVSATVTVYPRKEDVYPKLLEHIPTKCIVMFNDGSGGWLVGDPEKNSIRPIGSQWTNCNPSNYRPFYGTVQISNLV